MKLNEWLKSKGFECPLLLEEMSFDKLFFMFKEDGFYKPLFTEWEEASLYISQVDPSLRCTIRLLNNESFVDSISIAERLRFDVNTKEFESLKDEYERLFGVKSFFKYEKFELKTLKEHQKHTVYRIIKHDTKIKVDGVWKEALVYHKEYEPNQWFVRTIEEFVKKFKPVI